MDLNLQKSKQIVGSYAAKFGQSGFLPDGALYVDGMHKFDGRTEIMKAMMEESGMDIGKALSVSGLGAGTTDATLVPVYVDPTIVDQTRRLTPLVELVPRVTNYGKTADYNKLTARGVTGYRFEDAALSEADDTIARASTSIKYAYSIGRVTGPVLAASRQYLSQQYIDALNLEVRNKTITMRYIEEDAMINGSATARTGYGGVTTLAGAEPVGLRGLITTTATNYSSTPALTIPIMRILVKAARTAGASTTLGQGDPNLVLTDWGTLDTMKGLIQDSLRYVNTSFEIAWGLRTVEFEGLPVIASRFMPETTGSREVLVVSTDTIQNRVLQDLTYEELAKTNDSYKFMIKLYNAPIVTAEMFNARGYNFT